MKYFKHGEDTPGEFKELAKDWNIKHGVKDIESARREIYKDVQNMGDLDRALDVFDKEHQQPKRR